MQPLEIDSAVFCDGARYTIISRENSSILTCPVTSGAGVYTLNRVEARERSLSLTDPETQARGAKRAAGSTLQGEAAGRGPAL